MSAMWSSGMRDTGIQGLAALFIRADWRESPTGAEIGSILSAALHDNSPLVRMQAAHAAKALHHNNDLAATATALGDLLVTEANSATRLILLHHFTQITYGASSETDAILRQLLEHIDFSPRTDEGRVIAGLLTFLALIHRTPFASKTIERWCGEAMANADTVEIFAQCARDYLSPASDEGRSEAFRLLTLAAQSCQDTWTRHSSAAETSPHVQTELQRAAELAHDIAQQVYFASGAYNSDQQAAGPKPGPEHAAFAELAYPLLATCTAIPNPQSIHAAVETLIFLAPLDEPRALQAIAKAIPRHSMYASDTITGNDVMSYLDRLVSENRQLILDNSDNAKAFAHLLACFAAAGNSRALTLAYTFAEVFR
ncbi:hypothetical protein [Nocardia sp. NPDC049707]|uniref:hypothetical protein n=1 Tax=Nocardia sp. NPDC049707 TaxID=3154735 RepID=UPI00341CAC30